MINKILKDYFHIDGDVTIKDGTVSVDGNVKLTKDTPYIPVQFGTVKSFYCFNKKLTSLVGSPFIVTGDYVCSRNDIKTLIGSPNEIRYDFDFSMNEELTSLEGSPTKVGGDVNCRGITKISSFNNLPEQIGGELVVEWSPDVGVLSLIKYHDVNFLNNHIVRGILKKFYGQKPLRPAIIQCQKELIDAGFRGNAKL